MNVLSLFDGMSCGQVALERAGLPVNVYYASEIDKHAIKVALTNHPKTVELGDVRVVRAMAEAGFLGHIDLLIAGSPCQGFSFAGKQLAFDDPRSALFFEFVKTLEALRKSNPNIKFLLENVRMKQQHLDVITGILGVEPMRINSNLVSAQNRDRFYWFNWSVDMPADRGIFLKDVIDCEFPETTLCSNGQLNRLANSTDVEKRFSVIDPDKAACMTARQYANWKGTFVSVPDKSYCLTANYAKIGAPSKSTVDRYLNKGIAQLIPTRNIVGVSRNKNGIRPIRNDGKNGSFGEFGTIGLPETKSAAVSVTHAPKFTTNDTVDHAKITYRKLTPVECERLQTLPDNYTAGVSDSQRYKMLGNGWTVDVVAHIFKGLLK